MSGYFGALMRSSGLPFGGGVPVVAPAVALVGPHPIEIDVERPAAMPARIERSASTPRDAVASIPTDTTVERPAQPAPIAADASAHPAQPELAAPERAHPRVPADTPDAARVTPAARAVETPKPDLGQALVRAAMKWVAAEPPPVRHAARAPLMSEASQPVRAEETRVVTTEVRREREIDRQVLAPGATPVTAVATDPSVRESVAAQAMPIRSARSTLTAPPVAVAPRAADEVVEVSIGAIHVRVDAPVAQTIAQPSARPPAAPPSAASTSRRSALSRRALRRI